MHMKLQTSQKIAISDENFLFEHMGLTKTNSSELGKIFDKKIIDFLKNSELVNVNLPSSASCTYSGTFSNSKSIQSEKLINN